MQNTNAYSPYVGNIIPLANLITNTSGLDPVSDLSNAVASLQTMVNPTTHTVYTDYLASFTNGNSINVLSPLNLSNVAITSNNIPFSIGSSGTIGSSGSFVTAGAGIQMGVNGTNIITIDVSGNTLVNDITRVASKFCVSSMILKADSIYTSTINVGNTCYAQTFVTLSDSKVKSNMSSIMNVNLDSVGVYKFRYAGSSEDDIGILAQELEEVYPECVVEGNSVKYVKYGAVVALLLGEVRDLKKRVAALEAASLS